MCVCLQAVRTILFASMVEDEERMRGKGIEKLLREEFLSFWKAFCRIFSGFEILEFERFEYSERDLCW